MVWGLQSPISRVSFKSQNNARVVADANKVDHLIKTWWRIYSLCTKLTKNRPACDAWVHDVKAFGNLYAYDTLGQIN